MSVTIPDVSAQLFHSATTINTKDTPLDQVPAMTRAGMVRLFPHPEVQLPKRLTWSEDPLDDANWRFQYHCLLWVDRVRAAAIETGDTDLLGWYENTLRSWITLNPQAAPASDYSWFDMAVGLRAIVLTFAIDHFGPQDWLLEALEMHGDHLADPAHYDERGNHGLHQDLGLVVAAHVLGRQDWLDLATSRILAMFDRAIDEQGVCREGSVDYQYRNYVWYQEAATRLEAAGAHDAAATIRARLAEMTEFLAHATSPTGNYALLGDTVLHAASRIAETAADWVRDRDQAPESTVALFDTSGYLFARKAWTTFEEDPSNAYLTQRFGPGRSTAVHGHEDGGSITLDACGTEVLRDSGLYAYEAGPERLYFRGRSSHNVIDVPGRKFYPSAHCELLASSTDPDAVFTSVKSTSLQGVVWHRATLWCPNESVLLIDDRVILHDADRVLQRWHLPVGAQFDLLDGGATVQGRLPNGAIVRIAQINAPAAVRTAVGSSEPFEGWFSGEYRSKVAAPSIAFELTGEAVRFTTAISYGPDNDSIPEVSAPRRTSKTAQVDVTTAQGTVSLALTSQDAYRKAP